MAIKVALLCPVAQVVHPKVFQSALAMVSYASAHGYEVSQIGVTERTLVHQARNQLALGFKNTDCEWAFWMDSDMTFPPETIVKLIETAKELDTKFITGVYYQRLGEHLPVLWRKNPEREDGGIVPPLVSKSDEKGKEAYLHHFIVPTGQKPFKADVAGFGCIAMHRELVEKIPYPYFKTLADDCSEDFYFCIQAKEAGYQLWADPSLVLEHESQPVWITKKHCTLTPDRMIKVKT